MNAWKIWFQFKCYLLYWEEFLIAFPLAGIARCFVWEDTEEATPIRMLTFLIQGSISAILLTGWLGPRSFAFSMRSALIVANSGDTGGFFKSSAFSPPPPSPAAAMWRSETEPQPSSSDEAFPVLLRAGNQHQKCIDCNHYQQQLLQLSEARLDGQCVGKNELLRKRNIYMRFLGTHECLFFQLIEILCCFYLIRTRRKM